MGFSLPEVDMDEAPARCASICASELDLPEVSEIDVMRHFVRLSQKNYSIDTGFYPLGSCTMKYNPKVHEDVAHHARLRADPPLPARGDGAGRAAGDVRACRNARRRSRAWTPSRFSPRRARRASSPAS